MAQYLKPDSELGYIEDQAKIEKLKIDNARHTILGCMLGDFDETGAYVVDPEIVKELIEMPKFIVDTLDNIEVCKGVLKLDKHISFMVTYEGNKVSLILVEKLNYEANFAINSGTYSNVNEYVLDTVETSGEINRNAIYIRWNIGDNGGNVLDIFSCDEEVLAKYFGIVKRFKYLLCMNKVLLDKEEEIEELESSYTNEVMDALKHYPKLEDAVLKQILETLAEKKDSISVLKPNFAKTFNELLENTIEQNIGALTEEESKEFLAEKRNAEVNFNIKRSEIFELNTIDFQDDEDNIDYAPKIIRLKADDGYILRTITEHGEAFITANKEVLERIKAREQKNQTEKSKLIATLVGSGAGALIGGAVSAVVGAVTSNLVVEAAEKISEAKNGVGNNTKRQNLNTAASSNVKKGGVRRGGGGSTQQKKQESTKKKKRQEAEPHLTRKEREKLEAEERAKRRQYPSYESNDSGSASNDQSGTHSNDNAPKTEPEKLKIDIPDYSPEKIVEIESRIEKTNVDEAMKPKQEGGERRQVRRLLRAQDKILTNSTEEKIVSGATVIPEDVISAMSNHEDQYVNSSDGLDVD